MKKIASPVTLTKGTALKNGRALSFLKIPKTLASNCPVRNGRLGARGRIGLV